MSNKCMVIIPAGSTEVLDGTRTHPTTQAPAEYGDDGSAQDVEQSEKDKSSSKLDCKTRWKHYTVPMILFILSLVTFLTSLGIGE